MKFNVTFEMPYGYSASLRVAPAAQEQKQYASVRFEPLTEEERAYIDNCSSSQKESSDSTS